LPEDAGIQSKKLQVIDSLAGVAIEQHATPGCQVWVAKDGKVIFQKSYGNFTYDRIEPVTNGNLFDVASITKIAATTMMLMKLYEAGKLDLNKSISEYLPEFKGTDKQNVKIHQLLTHEAGFRPWIPFYKSTLDTAVIFWKRFTVVKKEGVYSIPVTTDIFMNINYLDAIWKQIVDSPLVTPGKYVYSDLDFYVLKKIAEQLSGESMDKFISDVFFQSLGLDHTCFNPLSRFSKEEIVPSNYDFTFRKELLQGTVHDQGAAMEGGIAGHAGLFSNADDLGTLMQMLLNNGVYAGSRYLDSTTIHRFTSRYSLSSRRGLGFDKPETQDGKSSPACSSASPSAYGHQGFTGTCVWVDPSYRLVYVFLSNRTFPDDQNTKLNSLGTRITIQQAIYDAIMSGN
jgi:CubicO group peptidase (beta-lactamase class C family)